MSKQAITDEASEAVDFEVLLRLKEQTFDGEVDLVPELIDAFLEEVPGECQDLQALVSAGDITGVRKTAHHMRSSTSNLGANRMTQMCARLEEMARGGSLNGAEAIVSHISREMSEVKASFERYLSNQS